LEKNVTVFVICTILLFTGIIINSNVFAVGVPDWVKNTAGWWADDAISETEFLNAIEFLVKENIIQVNISQTSETAQSVPEWVKNTAGWWAGDAISETEFVNAIEYLIKVGIINIESSKNPKLFAEMWANGQITDDEFLTNIEYMIEAKGTTESSITKTSQIPDWLANNAGLWVARILTNSDFYFNPEYIKEEIYPCGPDMIGDSTCLDRTYNSHGFRGNEFQKQKHDIDFRIFVVGGSTTVGSGASNNETWPAHLQQIINEEITNKKIEVINAGISGATSETEYNLIKNKISTLEPDLIIMYDGWNDSNNILIEKTIQNWKSVCEFGKNNEFDTIIIVQPLPSTGYRVLTEQEITNGFTNLSYVQKSQQYVNAFDELDKICMKTADFRGIFDYVQKPIFTDNGHTMSLGNKIIADNVFSIISNNFGKTYSITHSTGNNPEMGVVYAVGADLSGRNFDNLNLQNAIFDKTDLSNTSFKNANIDGARFVLANIKNSNLLERNDFSNINLAGIDLSNVNLKGKNLTYTNLVGVDLTNNDLTGTILTGANLSYANLAGVDLTNNDLTGTILRGADLSGANLAGVDLTNVDLTDVILDGIDLSEKDLTGTILTGADLSGANLAGVDLTGKDLTGVILRNVDLSGKDLTGTILRGADLSGANLDGDYLSGNDFKSAKFNDVDLSGKDLSKSIFNDAIFKNTNMMNANLYEAIFIQVDLTKIKNKSLAGTNLFGTSFALSNLSGIDLSGSMLTSTNFSSADLSDVDFTVADTITDGLTFIESNLTNSNFEGLDLAPKVVHTYTFQNKAHLQNLDQTDLLVNLFGEYNHILILSTTVNGNDLVVNYIYFNSFAVANLENANFKNTILWNADFYQANLRNADFSGADLREAFLGNADLSNANLDGANLTDAIIDEYTILACKNHPICSNE